MYGHCMGINGIRDECDLVSAALALGARTVAGWSKEEDRLASRIKPLNGDATAVLLECIQRGSDPLGVAFCNLRPKEIRRVLGSTYTPAAIVGLDASLGAGALR